MSFWDRIYRRNKTVQNVEPNRIHTVAVDDIRTDISDKRSHDWVTFAPPKIKPTIKNRRKASSFPTVYGILNNLIMKSISSYVIDGENQDAVDCILEADKVWNIRNLMYECVWKNLVDGECFYEKTKNIKGHVGLRLLAFDGETKLIKKGYDEFGEIEWYKQLVIRKESLDKWQGRDFWDTCQESDLITVDFEPEEISNPQLISIDGVGQSLVKNVIDIAYYLESLTSQMPTIVFKSANIITATFGNADRGEYKIDEETRDYVADQLSDYHNKGVVTLPWGIEVDNVGNPVLPKVEEYVKSLKAMLYEGLISPESLYSSESSNRSTAQVQLTSEKTGYVLFIQFIQEFLKSWIERDLFDRELKKCGFEEGDAYITFQTNEEDLDTNYLEVSDNHSSSSDSTLKNEKGSTAYTTDNDPYKTYNNKSED